MHLKLLSTAFAICATGAFAETLTVSPIPDNAEDRFCYYAGLAYSEDASLTLDVPDRRQGTDALQKRLFVCSRPEGSDSLKWVGVDVERQGLSGN